MAMEATEIDRNGDVALLEIYKSSPDVSMDGSWEEHSQILESHEVDSPVLTMETSTQASSTASLHDEINGESDNDLEEPVEIDENSIPSVIEEICPVEGPCVQCEIEQPCSFRFTNNGETLYVCNEPCIKAYQAEYPGKYTVTRKKYIIEEITPQTLLCSECEQDKKCYFYHNFDGEETYYCSLNCLEGMMADEKDKYAFNLNSGTLCIDQIRPKEGQCLICEKVKPCEFSLVRYGEPCLLCERACVKILSGRERGRYYIKKLRVSKPAVSNAIDKNLDEAKAAAIVKREQSFLRRCSQCTLILLIDGNVLTWEAMDFCDERCLERFQNGIGYRCAKCNTLVQHTSLGKYCVRFGYDIRQFCNSTCLEEYKKGLKICCYCQRDIAARPQVFLAPVGNKGQFKLDFCSQSCVEIFDKMSKNPVPQPVWAKCAVCSLEKATTIEVEVTETASQRLCSNPCFAAFKFANNILPDQCKWCKKYFKRNPTKSFTIYDDSNPDCFCSLSCMTIHINHTKFMVCCDRCKSKKYNFDMIRRVGNQSVTMCSLQCLSHHQESENAPSSSKSERESYGDAAVGYVQVRREKDICVVKARITPEHNVRQKCYSVTTTCKCNETEGEILSVQCEDCAAHLGGCKHAIAFLAWLHRRSEDPPSTSVDCYWKKSKLSSVGTSLKFIKAKDIGNPPTLHRKNLEPNRPESAGFLSIVKNYSEAVENMDNQLMKYYKEPSNIQKLSIHYLRSVMQNKPKNAKEFIEFCKQEMDSGSCEEAALATVNQSDCPLWYELRYARITASKAYEAANCKVLDGSLTECILGARKLKDTVAMKRGRTLESQVLKRVEQLRGIKIKNCGLKLDPNYPIIGASPDGVHDEYIIEVKCPSSEKAMSRYLTKENKVASKFNAQIQLQMHFYSKKKALFCVASNDFEISKNIQIIETRYDKEFCQEILNKCTVFWCDAIFPFLFK